MKIKSLFTGFDLTKNKIYEVLFEYDTGIYCRPKNFFEVVEENER